MQIQKLFNVLVVGGAMLTTGAIASNGLSAQPAAEENVAELTPAFCDPKEPEICETTACGKKQVKAGFECCWGTSCDETQP